MVADSILAREKKNCVLESLDIAFSRESTTKRFGIVKNRIMFAR